MKTPTTSRTKLRGIPGVLIGVAVLVLALGGLAVALWTANGEGNGDAHALSAVDVTLTGSAGAADLYPGYTLGDIHFNAANPNPYPVNFTSFTIGAITSDDVLCTPDNVTVTPVAINISVLADVINDAHSIPDVVTMVAGAPDACQGVTFTIVLHLVGSQT